MVYALTITILAAVLIVAVLAGGAMLARQAAGHGIPTFGRWRFIPSPLGLLVLPLLAALVIWRVPGLLLIAFLVPFLRRGGFRLPFLRGRDKRDERTNGRDDDTLDGQYRHLDDE